MQNNIQLAIPQPCHENWDQMTLAQQGRFCNACATTVTDFTNMSDVDLINFFKNKVSGDYCGRVLPLQLDRDLQTVISRKIPFGYAILIFLVIFFFSRQSEAKAQTTVVPDIYTLPFRGSHTAIKNKALFPGTEINASRAVSGKIFGINGEPVTGAQVKQVNGKSTFITKENGSFVFLVEGTLHQIEVSAPGFQTKIVSLTSEDHYEITLQPKKEVCVPRPEIMGKIVIRKTAD